MLAVIPKLATAVNPRLGRIGPGAIRAFDNQISQIPGLIKLTLGEPDFAVPGHVKRAAVQSIEADDSHYGPTAGKLRLREAIAVDLWNSRGVHYDPASEIVVTDGATEALAATIMGLFGPGDQVLIPTPAFSLYLPLVQLAGATPVMIDTSEDGFLLTAARLTTAIEAAGGAVRGLIFNDPVNPTGQVYPAELIDQLAAVLAKHHLLVVTDEIYRDLTYDRQPASLASRLANQTILVSGMSKSHAMTGYRLGYLAGPAALVQQVTKLHGLLVTTVNNAAQAAALEGVRSGKADPANFRTAYRKRRNLVARRLRAARIDFSPPAGAFYLFMRIPAAYGQDDRAFALDLAQTARVGLIPGSAFGAGGQGYVRLSYAAATDQLQTGLDRLIAFVEQVNKQKGR